ncbi:MAG TPA: enoyl-CoA hydratase-related protein [Pseudonocardiaceae bacterium]|jgi:enoyl-CoA hydratase/carnithine racemase|nr:enoyl-CoA hydratase-related protein [Pseudonocardiaceae bacterium]
MTQPSLSRDGDVFVLDLGDGENRFHPDWLAAMSGALDEIEGANAPRALVTSATGKHWSNGLDLDWLGANADQLNHYVTGVHELFARVLTLPLPTVAAIQGHAFAAGAMLALAHDFRVMRADRGYFCVPEVDIQIPFTPGMSALIQAKLTPKTAHEAMTTGRRFGGNDALAAQIVDAVAEEGAVLPAALELARPLTGKPGGTLGVIKSRMYPATLSALRESTANAFGS